MRSAGWARGGSISTETPGLAGRAADGDARRVLNLLELAADLAQI
jgi:replication-associated recombination protein RarA